MMCLYSTLTDIYFGIIFLQSVACLFILLILSFTEQKLLIKSSLSIISFMGYAAMEYLKGHHYSIIMLYPKKVIIKVFSISSRNLKILYFTFKAVIYFELIFAKSEISLCLIFLSFSLCPSLPLHPSPFLLPVIV